MAAPASLPCSEEEEEEVTILATLKQPVTGHQTETPRKQEWLVAGRLADWS